MLKFKPPTLKTPGLESHLGAAAMPAVPPPGPDALYTGYTGAPGFIESLAVVSVTAAAAWVGITTALETTDQKKKIAGWVGGVGSALFGLLYLGGKTGLNQTAYLPAIRVTPN